MFVRIYVNTHVYTYIYTYTSLYTYKFQKSRVQTAPLLIHPYRGSFLPYLIPYLYVPSSTVRKNPGSTNINTVTHLLNPIIHLNSFRIVLPTPLQKAKLMSKSSLFFYVSSSSPPKTKGIQANITFINYLVHFFVNPLQYNCVIHLKYNLSVSVSSLILVDFILFLNMENSNMFLKVKTISKKLAQGSVIPS